MVLGMVCYGALVVPLLAGRQAAAQEEKIEPEWRQSLQVDIKNGAPRADICNRAMARAGVSNDVDFKNWAYGIVRQYCPLGTLSKGGSAARLASARLAARLMLSQGCPAISLLQIDRIMRGQQVIVARGNCYMRFN